MIKTAIIEANEYRRERLKMIVDQTPGFVCTAVFASLSEAARVIKDYAPDILLCNVIQTGKSDERLIRAIQKKFCRLPVLVLNLRQDTDSNSQREKSEDISFDYGLTPHEKRILKLLIEGHNHTDSAKILKISYNTVKFHMRRIYQKLEVHSKSAAVAKAMRYRLTE